MKASYPHTAFFAVVRTTALAAVCSIAGVAQCVALECPVAHRTATHGSIKETPKKVHEYEQILAARGEAAVPDIAAWIRNAHPHASDAQIVNYLVTTYCPVIARNASMSEQEKKNALRAFARRTTRKLYR